MSKLGKGKEIARPESALPDIQRDLSSHKSQHSSAQTCWSCYQASVLLHDVFPYSRDIFNCLGFLPITHLQVIRTRGRELGRGDSSESFELN